MLILTKSGEEVRLGPKTAGDPQKLNSQNQKNFKGIRFSNEWLAQPLICGRLGVSCLHEMDKQTNKEMI